MLVSIRDCRHLPKDRQWIESIYSEYLDDLSQLNTGIFPMMVEDAPRDDEIFANWFNNEFSHPLLVLKGEEAVGFALVTRPRIGSDGEKSADYLLSEFFIRHPYRRVGIGREAATLIFNRFAGDWEIIEYNRNPTAVAFWRGVLTRYTRGQFKERSRDGVIRQRFRTPAAPTSARSR